MFYVLHEFSLHSKAFCLPVLGEGKEKKIPGVEGVGAIYRKRTRVLDSWHGIHATGRLRFIKRSAVRFLFCI